MKTAYNISRRWTVPFIALACCCLLAATGCSDAESAARLDQARRHLQLGRPQDALDTLADPEHTEPETHYLKALALARLDRRDAAKAEIQAALDAASEQAKYRAYELRLRLFGGDREAVDTLIDLHREHASSAAVSLFAVLAREAKAMQLASQKKVRAAQAQTDRAKQALQTALALSAAIPEFDQELVALAVRYKLSTDAERIAEHLVELEPENANLARMHIQTLLFNNHIDAALSAAKELYRQHGKYPEAAETYAVVLAKADASREWDRTFEDLRRRHPFNVNIVAQYAIYLTRSDRLTEACSAIDEAIRMQKQDDLRQQLIQMAVALPLEAETIDAAERAQVATRQLARYHQDITEELLVTYLEGRILYLQGQHKAALDKMVQVVQSQQSDVGGLRPFGREALAWMQKIMADNLINEQLKKAVSAVKDAEKPTTPADQEPPTEPQPDSNPTTQPR